MFLEDFRTKKLDPPVGASINSNFNQLACRNENFSTSLSSSSSEQNRTLATKSSANFFSPPLSKLSYSGVSSGGLSNSFQTHSSIWSTKPLNLFGIAAAKVNSFRDNGTRRFETRRFKCRPILNLNCKGFEEGVSYGEWSENNKHISGMENMKIFECYEENPFDDLEREAIEQWPSDDNLEIYRSNHLQVFN